MRNRDDQSTKEMILRACILALLFATPALAQNESWERERREIGFRKIERLEGQISEMSTAIQEERVAYEQRLTRLESAADLTRTVLYGAIGLILAGFVGRIVHQQLAKLKD